MWPILWWEHWYPKPWILLYLSNLLRIQSYDSNLLLLLLNLSTSSLCDHLAFFGVHFQISSWLLDIGDTYHVISNLTSITTHEDCCVHEHQDVGNGKAWSKALLSHWLYIPLFLPFVLLMFPCFLYANSLLSIYHSCKDNDFFFESSSFHFFA